MDKLYKNIGVKFKTGSKSENVDEGIYYYKLEDDGINAVISWFTKGVIGESRGSYTKKYCEECFNEGLWVLV